MTRVTLLDGGMGRELRRRGVPISETIWSASALLHAPEVVRVVHDDFIAAGAEVITANTYGIVPRALAREGLAERFEDLTREACAIARAAADAAPRPVLVAGSLPPQGGSYRPDLVPPTAEIEPLYRTQAEAMAPLVDLLICETMSSAREARAAASGAAVAGKPVWVSFTLHEDRSGRLRSGETVGEAVRALAGLPVAAVLANCCPPESITAAMPELVASGLAAGGYANAFRPVPEDWRLDGAGEGDGVIPLRDDLDPEAYAASVAEWIAAGAAIVGGCCGIGPAHIARLRTLLDG